MLELTFLLRSSSAYFSAFFTMFSMSSLLRPPDDWITTARQHHSQNPNLFVLKRTTGTARVPGTGQDLVLHKATTHYRMTLIPTLRCHHVNSIAQHVVLQQTDRHHSFNRIVIYNSSQVQCSTLVAVLIPLTTSLLTSLWEYGIVLDIESHADINASYRDQCQYWYQYYS